MKTHPDFYQVQAKITQINTLAGQLGKATLVIGNIDMPKPCYTASEAGFLRTVSWLYVIYNETGRVSIDYLKDKFNAYSIDALFFDRHLKNTRALRTYFYHNLDLSKPKDLKIKNTAEAWITAQCGVIIPKLARHWSICLDNVMQEWLIALDQVLSCLDFIQRDSLRVNIIADWNTFCANELIPSDFDAIIKDVANTLGMGWIDSVRFRNKHYGRWRDYLQTLRPGYVFEREARRLIVDAFLSSGAPMPLTDKEIVAEFGLMPSDQIEIFLKKAKTLFQQNPCGPQELVARLKSAVNTENTAYYHP